MSTTKTAQFTPGPWVVRPDSTIESKDGVTIASFVDNEADMSIISAAPAMYEALQNLVNDWERVHGPIPKDHEAWAALAQAEGRHHE